MPSCVFRRSTNYTATFRDKKNVSFHSSAADSRTRPGNPPSVASGSPRPMSPVKSSRVRSNSVSTPAALTPPPTNRKRTSSGVFQIDEAEPPPKKPEVARPSPEGPRKKPELISNGKAAVSADGDKNSKKEKNRENDTESAVKDTFDSEAKGRTVAEAKGRTVAEANGRTVAAFKESDSWD